MGPGIRVMVASRGEHAAKVLVKADAWFPRYPGGIRIQSLTKILDLLSDLHTARRRNRWLNLTLHFGLPTHLLETYPALSRKP
jgi:hypothetical protein